MLTIETIPTNTASRITEQYQRAASWTEDMFGAARVRTKEEGWRFNGVGSCAYIHSKEESELGLQGPAASHLIQLRDRINQRAGAERSCLTGCPHHGLNGCTAGIKAPICLTYFDNGSEWQKRFSIDTKPLREDIEFTLASILNGFYLDSEEALDQYRQRISSITERIKQEPVLYGGSLKDRARVFWRNLIEFPEKTRKHWEYTRR